jgi:hypothetical protein
MASSSSSSTRSRHVHRPATCAYLVYDLTSPVFSTSEIDAIFSPPSVSPPTSTTGWDTFLNSRIEHITRRPPSLGPSAVCIGEYSSASMAHPCSVHGVGQIFPRWDLHPAAKRFKQIIADTPVIQPTGNGPAHILKGFLDEFSAGRNPLDLTWVLKFLLVPKVEHGNWGLQEWRELCTPDNLKEGEFRQTALLSLRKEGMAMEDVGRRMMEFGKLFSVEVIIVSSLA